MRHRTSSDAFERANDLWYHEGRTAAAMRAYADAERDDPEDPVVAFQHARALLATGQVAQARARLAPVVAARPRLSRLGRQLLDELLTDLGDPDLEVAGPADDLDVDQLEHRRLSMDEWVDVSVRAHHRGMPAVEAYASGVLGGGTLESTRDAEDYRMAADRQLRYLAAMLEDPTETTEPTGPAGGAGTAAGRVGTGPLVLRAAAMAGLVTDDTWLWVEVRNVSASPQLVNVRLLANAPDAPPQERELTLAVTGPPGYRNDAVVQINAGAPSPADFLVLAPGASRGTRVDVNLFESMHVPGTYQVVASYANVTRHAAHGLDAFVGRLDAPPVELLRT